MYQTSTCGELYTEEHRVYISNYEKDGKVISPFHDIPLYVDATKKIVNMIVEIPRWTNAKFEIATGEYMNPLKQDVKKGTVRFVKNCFPYKGYIWNYGALPQTWEDPNVISPDTQARGDNDPIDVCEIGSEVGYRGQVKQVKILGVMALLDEGETDWKLIAIDINDRMAPLLNDVEDVHKHFPRLIESTHEWFKIYKMPDDKPANQFAFNGECMNRKYAEHVVEETHVAWKRLIQGDIPAKSTHHDIKVDNVTLATSPYRLHNVNIPNKLIDDQQKKEARMDNTWYYIHSKL